MGSVKETFEGHGKLCASHPWEVIIGTLSVAVALLSMGLITTADNPPESDYGKTMNEDGNPDLLILTIARCIAIIYVYLQFRNLRILGSKYLLGIAGIFTVFSSLLFSLAAVNVVGYDLQGFNEALPFFLLLVDLSRACALAKFALSSKNQGEVVNNIGHGMKILGPVVTLDTLVGTLVIGIGTLSGVRKLETMCCLGCLSVLANFLSFVTFYPATLSIVMELLSSKNREFAQQHFSKITKLIEEWEDKKKGNPVTNRVKLIMSAGLLVVHVNSRIVTSRNLGASHALEELDPPQFEKFEFTFLQKMLSPGLDYVFTACLAIMLLGKYIIFDSAIDKELQEFDAEFKNLKMASKLQKEKNTSDESSSSTQRDTSINKEVSKAPQLPQSGDTVEDNIELTSETLCGAENLAPVSSDFIHKHSASIKGSDDTVDNSCYMKNQTIQNQVIRGKRNPSIRFSVGESFDSSSSDSDIKKEVSEISTQTDENAGETVFIRQRTEAEPRSIEECVEILETEDGPRKLSDTEIIQLVKSRHIPAYKLETAIDDYERGVSIRRDMLKKSLPSDEILAKLPFANYDYKFVSGACCENVVGYMPVPVGVAGPLLLDGKHYQVPMATTEGCLVASTNRGCRALCSSGGVSSTLIGNGMTRAPVVRFPTAKRASEAKLWLEDVDNFSLVKESFDETSRFARLRKVHVVQAGRNLYIRFVAVTGDAMGMNMLSKGSEKALGVLQKEFNDMDILSLSGNFCTDKKPSAINWLEGRGKSVVCEAIVPAHVVKTTLKTSVSDLVDLNINKNLIGSAMAGSIGGFNAHASNIVTAIYIATGQDPAQNVASSNCMTLMEAAGEDNEDLYISCTMPSLEVGTVGGGTILPPQAACLKMLGVQGASRDNPGENAATLARVICGTVMAGELSLMSALAAGHLVKSHLKHNRSTLNMANGSPRKSLPVGLGSS